MSDDEIIVGCIVVVFLAGLIGGVLFMSRVINRAACHERYQDFEVRYGYLKGCQIKPEDKWIPASSYYFKEE